MKKTFTFLVTSNSQGQTKSYTLSSALVKFSLFLAVIALVFVVAIFVDYLGLLLESGENKRLKAENRILRQRFEVVENNVKSLENSLERVKGFSTKLRLYSYTLHRRQHHPPEPRQGFPQVQQSQRLDACWAFQKKDLRGNQT